MEPSKLDLRVPRGDTLAFSFAVTVNGTALDMSAYTARLQVRAAAPADDLLLDASSTGGEITMTTGGAVSVAVSATKTALVPAGTHEWGLRFSSPGIAYDTWLEGKYTAMQQRVRTT